MTNYNYNGAYARVPGNTGIKATWEPSSATGNWWISQTFPNQLWGQVGVFDGGWFYYIQDLSTGSDIAHSNWAQLKPADYTKPHDFEISLQGKHWRFLVDGKSVGSYGIGTTTGLGDFLLTNEFANPTDQAVFRNAQALFNGKWTPAPTASAFIMGTPVLGITGHLQDGSLPPGSLRIGGLGGAVTNGTQLW